MTLSVQEVKNEVIDFLKVYKVAPFLEFKIRDTAFELYGKNAAKAEGVKAAYQPYLNAKNGYYGRVDIVAEKAEDIDDLKQSLAHEILGHYALNTFTPREKHALLNSIIGSKDSLADLWDYVDYNYPEASIYLQAEEVYAKVAQDVYPELHKGIELEGDYTKTFLTEQDLHKIVLGVAEGIANKSREQQTFPHQDITHQSLTHIRVRVPKPRSKETEIEI